MGSAICISSLEQEEENREAQLHAHESGETWTGHRPEIVAVEQLPFLSVSQEGFVHTRSRTEVMDRCEENREKRTEKKRRRTLCTQRVRHPTSTASTKGNRNFWPEAKGSATLREATFRPERRRYKNPRRGASRLRQGFGGRGGGKRGPSATLGMTTLKANAGAGTALLRRVLNMPCPYGEKQQPARRRRYES
jgi:hypothetical protein